MNKERKAYKGRGPIWHVLILAFIFLIISATITPLNNLLARYALCPTAVNVDFRDSSGGIVDKPGTQQSVNTRVFTLFCEFEDGSVKEFENDTIIFTGFSVSAGLGAVVGLIVYLIKLLQSWSSDRRR
jgi:hypothetical protein